MQQTRSEDPESRCAKASFDVICASFLYAAAMDMPANGKAAALEAGLQGPTRRTWFFFLAWTQLSCLILKGQVAARTHVVCRFVWLCERY